MSDAAVRLLAPLALRDLLAWMLPGLPVEVETEIVLNPEVPRRIAEGQAFDVGITNPWYLPDLLAGGFLGEEEAVPLGRIPLAVGARDAPKRGIGLDVMLRGAESIAYTAEGTSGATFLSALDRMGLAEALSDRLLPLPAGGPVRAVSAGQAALAIAPLTTLVATPGLVTAALFPEGSGTDIPLSLFLSREARPGAAILCRALLDPARDADLAAAGLLRGN